MKQFTQGPWVAIEQSDGRYVIGTDVGRDPQATYVPIALAVIPQAMGGYEPERRANATLMATAPELYDALSSVVEVMEILRDEVRMPKQRHKISTAYLKAVNAIMHARGEAHARRF